MALAAADRRKANRIAASRDPRIMNYEYVCAATIDPRDDSLDFQFAIEHVVAQRVHNPRRQVILSGKLNNS